MTFTELKQKAPGIPWRKTTDYPGFAETKVTARNLQAILALDLPGLVLEAAGSRERAKVPITDNATRD